MEPWLLSGAQVREKFNISEYTYTQVHPQLLYLQLPKGGKRFPASYIEAAVKYLEANQLTAAPGALRDFAQSLNALVIVGEIEDEYVKRIIDFIQSNRITFAAAARFFNTSHTTPSTWEVEGLDPIKDRLGRIVSVSAMAITNACQWHVPEL